MESETESKPKKRSRYVKAVGPRLRILLYLIFGLFALLGANSAYLGSITFLEWTRGVSYQNYFYQYMFLGHLGLGFVLIAPVVLFGLLHIKNARNRPNRRAVRVGYTLFFVSLALLFSGIALTRLDFFEIRDPKLRSAAYWTHVLTPVAAIWLYILHRLAGPRIRWSAGAAWAGVVGVAVVGMVLLHTQDPREWNVVGPKEGEQYFHPSLARTASGNFIPAEKMLMNEYCRECHPDVYEGWFHSVHHISSFNNPPYLFSVRETRKVSLERDGNVKAARWCAGCHDPAPFFSGAFDDPDFDDVHHPTAHAGITCTTCHSITHVGSPRGNADYTIEEAIHYPFTFSTNKVLQFINRQLVKAKPEFHKKTFLKPLHQSTEFCSTCHKVHIPFALNHYKEFLRGQNHHDSFLLSGVSGHGARSFYYPPKAQENCNGCHMPLKPSDDFGADYFGGSDELSVHDHLFPAANTAIAHLRGATHIVERQKAFLEGCMRVDLFAIRGGGAIDGPLTAPLRPALPVLEPGEPYLLEIVVRTLTLGHHFTQGTADSNEVWLDVEARSGDRIVGRSGGMDADRVVDPWAHFINVYMLDRHGNRIDRRNPQDIFTPLYNHQMPPGAGQVVQYGFTVPADLTEPLEFTVKLQYRKFDTTYMRHVFGEDYQNDLPITTIATDRIRLGIKGIASAVGINEPSEIPEWQRWNDYGIGMLLKGDEGSEKGQLRQATTAFEQVEALGVADGPVNLARVYFKEGRLDDAVGALQRALTFEPPARAWTVAWLTGLVNKQNGFLDDAITQFRSVLEDTNPELRERGFDFSMDYVVINELGQALFERAKQARQPDARKAFLEQAAARFDRTLEIDPENLTAHYGQARVQALLGNDARAAFHREQHERYRPDDNARDQAIAAHRRRNPAADHAAQSIVIYPLQRPGAPGLTDGDRSALRSAVAIETAANRDRSLNRPSPPVPEE